LTMTHLDISYPEVPIKVCVAYLKNGKEVGYRPDQEYLNDIKPVYVDVPAWDGAEVQSVRKMKDLPKEALQYIAFISQALGVEPFILTTGPTREQTIVC
jgi:adenylosuccinate synthase